MPELARRISPGLPFTVAPRTRLRQAVVASVQLGTTRTLTLELAGETVDTVSGIRFLESYNPRALDTVSVLQNDTDLFVIGAVDADQKLFIDKATDTSRTSNTTFADDPHLTVPVRAGVIYQVFSSIRFEGAEDTGDIKTQWLAPSGSVFLGTEIYPKFIGSSGVSGAATTLRVLLSNTSIWGCNGAGSILGAFVTGILTVGVAEVGNLRLSWAQNTSSATATKVLAGSNLLLHKIG